MAAKTVIALYSTAAEIDKACIAFSKRGQSLQAEAHKLACSVLSHVTEHRDTRMVSKLINAMPEMGRCNAVKAWLEAFGPIAFAGSEIALVKGKLTDMDGAMSSPFWKFSPEPAYKPVEVAKALEALIKKLEKDEKETKRSHAATIAALKSAPVNSMLMIEHQPTAH